MLSLSWIKTFVLLCFFANLSFAQEEIPTLATSLANGEKVVFSASITHKKEAYAGLLVFKKQDSLVKVAFVSQIGMKFFEVHISSKGYEFAYLPSFLDNKGLQFILGNDLKLLVEPLVNSGLKMKKKVNGRKTLFVLNEEKELISARQNQGWAGKARVQFIGGNPAKSIEIRHKRINFALKLTRL